MRMWAPSLPWQEYGDLRTNSRRLSTVWGLGIELWSPVLAAVIFTHGAVFEQCETQERVLWWELPIVSKSDSLSLGSACYWSLNKIIPLPPPYYALSCSMNCG